jgi:hypothetical protein
LTLNDIRRRTLTRLERSPIFPRPPILAVDEDSDDCVRADLIYYPPMGNPAISERWRASLDTDDYGFRDFPPSRFHIERGHGRPVSRPVSEIPIPHLPSHISLDGTGKRLLSPDLIRALRLSAHFY